ncbi:unnamed protein product [Albugo candida]|uniref:RxLR effector protein n=1 Tax=Albugo candida TaxID=65357 RepID=A0A024GFE0_9STRA|nr:unnamed protein product [Albugo candida]|eukprot:CCI45599.1 unnamed protein product [Albugo candida]
MLVLMKKAVADKHIFILLLTLTSFSSQWVTPTQVAAHDTRTLMGRAPLLESLSLKSVRGISHSSKSSKNIGDKVKEKEINNEADKDAHNEPMAVRELAGSEESIDYGHLDTIHEKSDEDTGDYTSTRSGFSNEGTEGYSLDKKTLSPSGSIKSPSSSVKQESVNLRQNYPSFDGLPVGEDEEMESPKRKSQSSYGETDGEDMTETSSPLSSIQKHKGTVINEREQNQPKLTRSNGGQYEHILLEPQLTKSLGMKHRDGINLLTLEHSNARFL